MQQCPLRGQTITVPSEEGFLQQCPLRGQTHNSAPLQGGILKPPALRVVVDFPGASNPLAAYDLIGINSTTWLKPSPMLLPAQG